MKKKRNVFTSRLTSFGYAIQGLFAIMRQEVNMRIHLAAAIVVVIAGLIRHLTGQQWMFVAIAIALVWIAEAFNTAIEMLCDLYCRDRYNATVKKIKDIAASGVLLAAALSIIIAVFVFIS